MTATWHPSQGRGRPERNDWKPPADLANEPIGTYLLVHLRSGNRRLRAQLVGVNDDGTIDLCVKNEVRSFAPERILRYRLIASRWNPDDFVVRRGVPAAQWRGIVVSAVGEEVTVDAYPEDRRIVVDGATLELAADRPHIGTRVL